MVKNDELWENFLWKKSRSVSATSLVECQQQQRGIWTWKVNLLNDIVQQGVRIIGACDKFMCKLQ
jgi:hypothetical protein